MRLSAFLFGTYWWGLTFIFTTLGILPLSLIVAIDVSMMIITWVLLYRRIESEWGICFPLVPLLFSVLLPNLLLDILEGN